VNIRTYWNDIGTCAFLGRNAFCVLLPRVGSSLHEQHTSLSLFLQCCRMERCPLRPVFISQSRGGHRVQQSLQDVHLRIFKQLLKPFETFPTSKVFSESITIVSNVFKLLHESAHVPLSLWTFVDSRTLLQHIPVSLSCARALPKSEIQPLHEDRGPLEHPWTQTSKTSFSQDQ
jgi:hypothetical protein